MKNKHLSTMPLRHPPRRRPAVIIFWLLLGASALLGALLLAGPVTRLLRESGREPSESPQLRWLLTDNGERRGVAIVSDLAQDADQWELWTSGIGDQPLIPIEEFPPAQRKATADLFGFNGGFWDENEQPVGICAGEQGIHGARSHPNGFAIADGRAWIGPLAAHIRLRARIQSSLTSNSGEIQLNPKPAPRQKSYLIDPSAWSGTLPPPGPSRICWLRQPNPAPLRFNTQVNLVIRKVYEDNGLRPLAPPPPGTLLWVQPARADDVTTTPPRLGEPYQLELTLTPVQGRVQLATCAGPRLLRDGAAVKGLNRKDKDGNEERTWRTAIGCDATGRRVMAVLLARGKDGLPGVTLLEAAQTLQALGATEALNLDGGSSTTAWSNRLKGEFLSLFPLQAQIHHALFVHRLPHLRIVPM